MTTGSQNSTIDSGNYFLKDWSGSDGKYIVNEHGFKVIVEHNYDMTRQEHSGNPSKDYPNVYMIIGGGGSPYLNSEIVNDLTLKAQAKLVGKVRNHDFHLGKALGESRQAMGTVLGAMKTIGGSILDLRRGNFSSAARRLGVSKHASRTKLSVTDISGRWLELQYGWLPLMSDAYNSAKFIADRHNPPRVETLRTGARNIDVINTSTSPSNYSGFGNRTIRVVYKYVLTEELSEARSLGLVDPLGVAWEITPWSFVVDWFLPIGTYLDVLNILPILKGSWVKTESADILTIGEVLNPTYYRGCTARYHATVVKRTVGSGFSAFSIPSPSFKPLDKALSPLHITNAAALMTQQLFGGPKTLIPLNSAPSGLFHKSLKIHNNRRSFGRFTDAQSVL
jgi:hypothetical protein